MLVFSHKHIPQQEALEARVPGEGVGRPSKLSLREGIRVLPLSVGNKMKDLEGPSSSRRTELSKGLSQGAVGDGFMEASSKA